MTVDYKSEAALAEKFLDAEIDDIIENPEKYGAPTFEDFKKNPDKFRKRKDHLFEVAERGTRTMGKTIQKHYYYIEGYKCSTIENAQQTMTNMGISPDELQLKIELEDIGRHQAVAHIHFRRKSKLILPESNLILPEGT